MQKSCARGGRSGTSQRPTSHEFIGKVGGVVRVRWSARVRQVIS